MRADTHLQPVPTPGERRAASENAMPLLQVSHEELLLLLALARLPIPLSLGQQPFEGHNETTLNIVLASATSSLIVRGILTPATSKAESPAMVGGVEQLLADLALAESCLMVAARHGDQVRASAYALRGSSVTLHTNPVDRIHRLERLSDRAAVVEGLLQMIEPHASAATPLDFALDADPLGLAVEAIAANKEESARGILLTAGVAAEKVEAFLKHATGDVVRYTLAMFGNLRSPSPLLNGSLVLRGKTETWLVKEGRDSSVNVQAVDPPTLRAELHGLVQQMTKVSPTSQL